MPADGGDIRLDGPITQGELAAMVGSTRQSVNKLLGLLHRRRADPDGARRDRDPGPGRPPAGGPPLGRSGSPAPPDPQRASRTAAPAIAARSAPWLPRRNATRRSACVPVGRRDRDVARSCRRRPAARGSRSPTSAPDGAADPLRLGQVAARRRASSPPSSVAGAAPRARRPAGARSSCDERAVGAALRRGQRPAAGRERLAERRRPGRRAVRPDVLAHGSPDQRLGLVRDRHGRRGRPRPAREIRTSTASCRA